ncbi:hypothetical protein ON010_g16833 [Phytophthora cinnamomi]|nr:hypothetical protein ON010_g16833 [Phytophthora cinnamomi]
MADMIYVSLCLKLFSVWTGKGVVRENAFDPTGNLNRAFCFGNREDEDGLVFVGNGTDDDSFVVGVTSLALVNACIEYASSGRFTLFHADATFKLSDLAYPLITCGFSDSSRSYQLAAIFIASCRTAKEYAMCLSAFVRMVKQIRPSSILHIDAVMGDAEDVQLNGFQQVSPFYSATYLMNNGYNRYWRWQVFHTPVGCATTNNPCETFNAILKKYTGRRRYFMQRLLSVTMTVIQDANIHTPTADTKIHAPTTAASKAAASMIATGRIVVYAADNPTLCRLKQLPKADDNEVQELEDLSVPLDSPFNTGAESTEKDEAELSVGYALLVREQRSRAARLYNNVVTWSLWFAHSATMPEDGWITCCHIIVGRKAKRLSRPGVENKPEKLFNRQVRKAKPTSSAKKQKQIQPDHATDAQALTLIDPSRGRPRGRGAGRALRPPRALQDVQGAAARGGLHPPAGVRQVGGAAGQGPPRHQHQHRGHRHALLVQPGAGELAAHPLPRHVDGQRAARRAALHPAPHAAHERGGDPVVAGRDHRRPVGAHGTLGQDAAVVHQEARQDHRGGQRVLQGHPVHQALRLGGQDPVQDHVRSAEGGETQVVGGRLPHPTLLLRVGGAGVRVELHGLIMGIRVFIDGRVGLHKIDHYLRYCDSYASKLVSDTEVGATAKSYPDSVVAAMDKVDLRAGRASW